jgi:hypothetical protein
MQVAKHDQRLTGNRARWLTRDNTGDGVQNTLKPICVRLRHVIKRRVGLVETRTNRQLSWQLHQSRVGELAAVHGWMPSRSAHYSSVIVHCQSAIQRDEWLDWQRWLRWRRCNCELVGEWRKLWRQIHQYSVQGHWDRTSSEVHEVKHISRLPIRSVTSLW